MMDEYEELLQWVISNTGTISNEDDFDPCTNWGFLILLYNRYEDYLASRSTFSMSNTIDYTNINAAYNKIRELIYTAIRYDKN